MPDESRRIVIEKSSTVRRRYQRSNKQFRFTAAELKRIEREEELDRRAKGLRDKERKRLANKKKRDDQERERKRLGLPDPNAPKVPSSQPLLSNFLGLTRRPPPAPEPEPEPAPAPEPEIGPAPAHDNSDVDVGSSAQDTEIDSDGPDDLDEELEEELSCLQEAVVPEQAKEPDNLDKELDNRTTSIQEVTVPERAHMPDELGKELENSSSCLHEKTDPTISGKTDTRDESDDDTEPFDDLDEELERELFCLQETNVLGETENKVHNTSNETLASCSAREDDEFSDCSAFDDLDVLNAAEDVVSSIQPSLGDHPPSKPTCQPTVTSIPSVGDSFRDDTADYLEEVFARGTGDSFGQFF